MEEVVRVEGEWGGDGEMNGIKIHDVTEIHEESIKSFFKRERENIYICKLIFKLKFCLGEK